MTSEQKAARLDGMAAEKDFAAEHAKSAVFGGGTWVAEFTADAFILREAAQLMREREERSLLTSPDWKTMYEAQERDLAALRKELEELREKAELLEWALDHVVDYGSRTLEFVGGKYVIETPLRLKDPADFAELDCDEWNPQYFLAALRAARGEK